MKMKYQLVLQFDGKTEDDFNKLIEVEEELENGLKKIAEIDGHDFGSEEMNIFILTNDPEKALISARNIMKNNELFLSVRAAYREINGSKYKILWPESLKNFSIK
jgi:hypothetical protein